MLILFFCLWVIFNGQLTLEIAIIGLIIAAVLFAFTCKFCDYSVQQERKNILKVFGMIGYVFFLIKEIIKANISVIRLILTQKEEVEPALVTFHTEMKTTTGKAFLANAITLTPGTITVLLEDEDQYTVHCLDETMAEGLNDNEFINKIRRLEK